jgi:hypothetical protein
MELVAIIQAGLFVLAGCLAPAMQVTAPTVVPTQTDHMSMASARPDLMQVVMEALGKANPSTPTLTFDENGCTYAGPSELPTTITLTWNVADSRFPGGRYGSL